MYVPNFERIAEILHLVYIILTFVKISGQWSEEYARIIHRFRNIISAQFFGHTHFDEFEIFFGNNEFDERAPTNMAYLAPSMTTIEHLNPAYRIFMIDGKLTI